MQIAPSTTMTPITATPILTRTLVLDSPHSRQSMQRRKLIERTLQNPKKVSDFCKDLRAGKRSASSLDLSGCQSLLADLEALASVVQSGAPTVTA